MEIILKIIGVELLLILMLLLSELGILKLVYELSYTHPNTDKVIKFIIELIADMFYVVGGSHLASVVFIEITTTKGFNYDAFGLGLFFAIIGKYLKLKGV